MPTISVFQGTQPDEYKVLIDDEDLPPIARELLNGMSTHIGNVIGNVLAMFDIDPDNSHAHDILNALNLDTFERFMSPNGAITRFTDPTRMTVADGLTLLRDMLALALLLTHESMAKLCQGDFNRASRAHTHSVYTYAAFKTSLTNLLATCEHTEKSGPGYALTCRSDQVTKRQFQKVVKDLVESGEQFNQLDDLLDAVNYPPAFLKVSPRSLKAWAIKAGHKPFKAGAPKKK